MNGGTYVPKRGDLVWIRAFRLRRVTSRLADGPVWSFRRVLPLTGVVLSDQVKGLDWRARHAEWAARVPDRVVRDVLQKLATLVRPERKS